MDKAAHNINARNLIHVPRLLAEECYQQQSGSSPTNNGTPPGMTWLNLSWRWQHAQTRALARTVAALASCMHSECRHSTQTLFNTGQKTGRPMHPDWVALFLQRNNATVHNLGDTKPSAEAPLSHADTKQHGNHNSLISVYITDNNYARVVQVEVCNIPPCTATRNSVVHAAACPTCDTALSQAFWCPPCLSCTASHLTAQPKVYTGLQARQ